MAAKKVWTDAERRAQLLDTGAKLASKHGAKNVTRRMVANAAKVSEPLVTHYMGNAADAQAKYTRHAKKMGLALPDAAATALIGKRLRAHKPKDARDARPRSTREVKAIKDKNVKATAKAGNAARKVIAKKSAGKTSGARSATVSSENAVAPRASRAKPKPDNKALPAAPENKARVPMAPPPLPTVAGVMPTAAFAPPPLPALDNL